MGASSTNEQGSAVERRLRAAIVSQISGSAAVPHEKMNSRHVKPALTWEEWNDWRRREWLPGVHTINDIAGLEPSDKHKAAALALNGEAFGFTHHMLDALESVYSGCVNFAPSPTTDEERADEARTYGLVEQAISNLRALLPPRED